MTTTPATKKRATAKPVRTSTARRSPPGQSAIRKAIIATALEMSQTGLSPGRSGNVSARFNDGMLITPSGLAYDTLKPADISFVGMDGSTPDGQRKPSSEWRFHLAAYIARADRAAVVHTHSMHATALACAHKAIPAFHYMVAAAGGVDIPLIPYAPFGTAALADYVAEGLKDRDALLMANHGQIAIGNSLDHALELAWEVETLAQQYTAVLTLGKPNILSKKQMADVLERFKGYGQNAQSA
ncbi:MAG: class II aldolase/adducin family protein [Pseudomonadota bacterium]